MPGWEVVFVHTWTRLHLYAWASTSSTATNLYTKSSVINVHDVNSKRWPLICFSLVSNFHQQFNLESLRFVIRIILLSFLQQFYVHVCTRGCTVGHAELKFPMVHIQFGWGISKLIYKLIYSVQLYVYFTLIIATNQWPR